MVGVWLGGLALILVYGPAQAWGRSAQTAGSSGSSLVLSSNPLGISPCSTSLLTTPESQASLPSSGPLDMATPHCISRPAVGVRVPTGESGSPIVTTSSGASPLIGGSNTALITGVKTNSAGFQGTYGEVQVPWLSVPHGAFATGWVMLANSLAVGQGGRWDQTGFMFDPANGLCNSNAARVWVQTVSDDSGYSSNWCYPDTFPLTVTYSYYFATVPANHSGTLYYNFINFNGTWTALSYQTGPSNYSYLWSVPGLSAPSQTQSEAGQEFVRNDTSIAWPTKYTNWGMDGMIVITNTTAYAWQSSQFPSSEAAPSLASIGYATNWTNKYVTWSTP